MGKIVSTHIYHSCHSHLFRCMEICFLFVFKDLMLWSKDISNTKVDKDCYSLVRHSCYYSVPKVKPSAIHRQIAVTSVPHNAMFNGLDKWGQYHHAPCLSLDIWGQYHHTPCLSLVQTIQLGITLVLGVQASFKLTRTTKSEKRNMSTPRARTKGI